MSEPEAAAGATGASLKDRRAVAAKVTTQKAKPRSVRPGATLDTQVSFTILEIKKEKTKYGEHFRVWVMIVGPSSRQTHRNAVLFCHHLSAEYKRLLLLRFNGL